MKILSLLTRQVRIFPPEALPTAALFTGVGAEAFRKHYGFREVAADGPEITFQAGLAFLYGKDSEPTVINYVQVNPQRIIMEVQADSSVTTSVYEMIFELLAQGDQNRDSASYAIINHETVCLAYLDFHWRDLLADPVKGFISEDMSSRLSSPVSAARLAGVNFRLIFQFDAKDIRIREQGVMLMDKTVAIEPRQNTPLSDQLFFTTSPLDSDSHIELVRELERRLAPQQPPRKRAR